MNTLVEQVYETLTGQALAQYDVPGIEKTIAYKMFDYGSRCQKL